MRTRVIIVIDHHNLSAVTADVIDAVFDEAGDIDWTVTVESVTEEPRGEVAA